MPCNKEGPLMPTQKLLERKALIVGIVINVLQVLFKTEKQWHKKTI